MSLRHDALRIAKELPTGNGTRVALLRALVAKEFGTQDELDAYLKDHPKADPKMHSVVEEGDGGGSEDDDKAKDDDKGDKGWDDAAGKNDDDFVAEWVDRRGKGKGSTQALQEYTAVSEDLIGDAKGDDKLVYDWVRDQLAETDKSTDQILNALRDDDDWEDDDHQKTIDKAEAAIEKATGGGGKDEDKPKEDKPKAPDKVMTPEDFFEKFKGELKGIGVKEDELKWAEQELRNSFISTNGEASHNEDWTGKAGAKYFRDQLHKDLAPLFKDIDDDELFEMVKHWDPEADKGKKATMTLKYDVLRIASKLPTGDETRRAILAACQCEDDETDVESKFEEGKPADPTKNMSEEDAKKWRLENLKHKDQFKG
jgi:hypothetical protein